MLPLAIIGALTFSVIIALGIKGIIKAFSNGKNYEYVIVNDENGNPIERVIDTTEKNDE